MKLHITIMSHAGGLDCCKRHMPFWKAHDPARIDIITNTNYPIKQEDFPDCNVYASEESARIGRLAWARIKTMLTQLWLRSKACEEFTDFMVFEYDSLCLLPAIIPLRGFFGTCFVNKDSRYHAPRYALPPWQFDAGTLNKMFSAMLRWPDLYENGYCDRYLSSLAWLAGVPVLDHPFGGYAKNTIEARHIKGMQNAIRREGARMIHGIKDERALEAAVEAFKQAK